MGGGRCGGSGLWGLEVSGEFGGEEGAWGVKVCGLWGKLERKSNNDGKEGRAGNGKVWEYGRRD